MSRLPHPDSGWADCPRCRHRLLRWRVYRASRERPWIDWDEDRWLVPVPLVGVGLTLLLVTQAPLLLAVLGGSRGRVLVLTVGGLGFLWSAGVAAARHRWRLKRRRVLSDRLSPDDWVCPSCLHSVSA
ncbi:hypothetical protein [Deinococcus actinosclerus]|uniref:Uncharacterized protein n=1 Tax=Deinococcus actinosclerus TaxID=1768108 RepID=A0ABM5X4L6_9DEIO|nr:hypothetical protein [Deinococcus actinosclerus]ALW88613.1 hypothetical protein AUC44_06645 [Deinococcus actinosclerus]